MLTIPQRLDSWVTFCTLLPTENITDSPVSVLYLDHSPFKVNPALWYIYLTTSDELEAWITINITCLQCSLSFSFFLVLCFRTLVLLLLCPCFIPNFQHAFYLMNWDINIYLLGYSDAKRRRGNVNIRDHFFFIATQGPNWQAIVNCVLYWLTTSRD